MRASEVIRKLRDDHDLTQRDLAKIAGVSDKTVSAWECEAKTPRAATAQVLARYFGIPAEHLLYGTPEEPTTRTTSRFAAYLSKMSLAWGLLPDELADRSGLSLSRVRALLSGAQPTNEEVLLCSAVFGTANTDHNIAPVRVAPPIVRVPVLGRVPAGFPIEAVTDVVDEIELPSRFIGDGYEYFGLLVKGESMLPEYRDGDFVLVRRIETAETGDDVVAFIGASDATLKRFVRTENGLTLRPLNPAYDELHFTESEAARLPVSVAGIVVELRRVRRR